MENLELKPNLAKAVIAVMKDVKGVEKGLTVGSGGSSYKGVSDKDVKIVIGRSMAEHGLCILPIGIEPNLRIDRWESEEWDNFKKQNVTKQKQQVFTEVTTKYLLLHESGESIVLSGYGHGVDSQDKSAGKATTYSLKYALLYTFLVPTGDIDDSDSTHSDDTEVKPIKSTPKTTTAPKKVEAPKQEVKKEATPIVKIPLIKDDANYVKVVTALKGGYTLEPVLGKYIVEADLLEELKKLVATKK